MCIWTFRIFSSRQRYSPVSSSGSQPRRKERRRACGPLPRNAVSAARALASQKCEKAHSKEARAAGEVARSNVPRACGRMLSCHAGSHPQANPGGRRGRRRQELPSAALALRSHCKWQPRSGRLVYRHGMKGETITPPLPRPATGSMRSARAKDRARHQLCPAAWRPSAFPRRSSSSFTFSRRRSATRRRRREFSCCRSLI